MLDLSRLEAGKVKLSRDDFSLIALTRSIFEKLEMVLSSILGKCTLSTDKITPATILKIIGFVAIPFNVDDKVFD